MSDPRDFWPNLIGTVAGILLGWVLPIWIIWEYGFWYGLFLMFLWNTVGVYALALCLAPFVFAKVIIDERNER